MFEDNTFYEEKSKWQSNLWIIFCTFLLIVCLFFLFFRLLRQVPTYESHVLPEDCALCGSGNDYRGTDTIALVSTHRWDIANIGVKHFCGGLENWENRCTLDWTNDDYLTKDELAHKYAPLDINGVLKEEIGKSYSCYRNILQFDDNGTTGWVNTSSEHNIVYGVLDLDHMQHAQNEDHEKLSTLLCPDCYEKTIEATEINDCFFLNCRTGELYPVLDTDWNFNIGDYRFHIQYRSKYYLSFVALYEHDEPEEE